MVIFFRTLIHWITSFLSLLGPSESDGGNNFKESPAPGSITGYVFNDINADTLPDVLEGLSNVTLSLFHDNDKDGHADSPVPITTQFTDAMGFYAFVDVPIGNYVLAETQPIQYVSIKDYDFIIDLDSVPNTDVHNDTIPVTILNGELDDGNYFAEVESFLEIFCPPDTTINCQSSTDPMNTGFATTSDNCEGVIITHSETSTQNPDENLCSHYTYVITRTWEATDDCGDFDTCIQIIQVQDITAPAFTFCPPNLTINCPQTPNFGTPIVSDACDPNPDVIVESTVTIPGGGCPQEYSMRRTWFATDACGNSSSCSQTIQVRDLTPPLLTCPANITINCDESTLPSLMTGFATATDLCTLLPTISYSDQEVSGECPSEFFITRTWTATDECLNSATCIQLISVQDTLGPVWVTPVGSLDTILECSDVAGLAYAQALFPTANDNCATGFFVNKNSGPFVPGSCPQAGTITNRWFVKDTCNNSGIIFYQTITIVDTTAPQWLTVVGGLDTTLECSDVSGLALAQALFPQAVDNCDTDVDIIVKTSGTFVQGMNCPQEGTFINTWTVTDDCGNTSSVYTQTITIIDTTPPIWLTVIGTLDRTLECSDAAGIAAAQALFPVASDNCDNNVVDIVKVSGPLSGGFCPLPSSYTNTWTVTDDCGNISASFTQTITVEDNTAPGGTTVTGSLDATLECSDATGIALALAAAPSATDNCDATPTIHLLSDDTTPGSCQQEYVRVRVWNFTDDCGNTSAPFTQTITLEDNTAPGVTTVAGSLDATLECSDVTGITLAMAAAPTATDNCDVTPTIHLLSDDTTPGSCLQEYVQVRVWNFTDECGNTSASFTQTITVEDNTAPGITTVAGSLDATLECSDVTGIALAMAAAPTATDNCDATPTIHMLSDDTTPGSCQQEYVRVRVWNFTDDCGNTSAPFTQTITVEDNTAPGVATVAGSLDATLECSDVTGIALAMTAAPTATDNCDATPTIHLLSDDTTPGSCQQEYVRVRVWNFTDDCGNTSASFTQTITVEDNTAPGVTTVAGSLDATLECSDVTGIALAITAAPSATDNCDATPTIHLLSDDTTPGTCQQEYVRVRVWNFTDDCGNISASFTQTITVEDNTAPGVTTVAGSLDATLECSDVTGIALAIASAPSATDNCDATPTIHLLSDDTTPGSCQQEYVRVRVWNFTDDCGNTSAPFTQTITVEDNTAPGVTTVAGSLDATLECSDATGIALAIAAAPSATDNCDATPTIHLLSDDTTPGSCQQEYVRVRVWNFTDDCGNTSAPFTQTITVEDNTAPGVTTVTGSLDATLECSDVTGIALAIAAAPSATDNCDATPTIHLLSDDTTPGSCQQEYVRVRVWNFTDDCGNTSASFTQTITVEDNTAPGVTTVAGSLDATLECSDVTGIALAIAAAPSATDNCDATPTIHLLSDDTTPGSCQQEYVRVRVWNFTDDCGNTSASFTQTITVEDNTAPGVTTVAGSLDATLECSDATGIALAMAAAPTATDNCDVTPTIHLLSDDTTPGSCQQEYVRVRVWNFTDDCGNTSAPFTQTITVEDNTAPGVTTVTGSLDATLECSDVTGIALAMAAAPTATDNCDATPTIHLLSDDTTPGSCQQEYVRVRVWNFTDDCGNTSAPFTQTITVEDNTAPGVTTVAGSLDATLECSDATGIALAIAAAPSATDNCDVTPTIHLLSDDTTPGSCQQEYVRVRVWNFTDDCGNTSASFTQTITVEDNTAPGGTTVTGSLDATLECSDATGIALAMAAAPSATDNCDATPTIHLLSDDTTPGSCQQEYVRVRVWNFTDDCGNTSASFTQTITVEDNTAPGGTTVTGSLDATLECSDVTGIALAMASAPSATDNCDATPTIHLLSDDTTPGSCQQEYVRVRVWNFTDDCGNTSAPFTQTITVEDNTAPGVTTVAGSLDATLECSDVTGIALAIASAPSATDNCDATPTIHLLSDDTTPGSCQQEYVRVRVWNFTDDCGNTSAPFTQTITVEDNTAPGVTTVAGSLDATLECSDATGITLAMAAAPSATDNCDATPTIHLLSDDTTPGSCQQEYVRVRVWNFTDDCGNTSAPFTQTITVEDNTAPGVTTVTGSLDATLECSDATGIALAIAAAPSATDNCDATPTIHLLSDDTTPGSCQQEYVRVRVWNFTDACGNTSAPFTQTITVEDNTAPGVTTVAGSLDATLECSDATGIAAGDSRSANRNG